MNARRCICCGNVFNVQFTTPDPNVCNGCLDADWAQVESVIPSSWRRSAQPQLTTTATKLLGPVSESWAVVAAQPPRPVLSHSNYWAEFDLIARIEAAVAARKALAQAAASAAQKLEHKLVVLKRHASSRFTDN
jgi:hypothetical protein